MSSGPGESKRESKRVMCGVLAILLGSLGVHKFVLGMTTPGIIMLALFIFTCGSVSGIIGLIEGIIYLTKSDEEFYQTYEVGKKGWF
jgi:TM2 domain-containing membrane protein YozV